MMETRLIGAVSLSCWSVRPLMHLSLSPRNERTMRVIHRIFYFHAASAWAGLTAFFICFIANLLYVWRRQEKWDSLGVSSAEVGLGVHYCRSDHRTHLGHSRRGEFGGPGTPG